MNRLLLLLAVFLVSTAGLFAHRALAEAAPLAIAAWRLGLAAVFFVGLSASRRDWSSHRRGEPRVRPLSEGAEGEHKGQEGEHHEKGEHKVRPYAILPRLLLAGLCLALHFVTWFAALDRTPVARATLLACTTPLWTTLGGLFLGRRRPFARDAVALAIAGVGLALVTHAAAQMPTPTTLTGDLFGLLAGLLFGAYLLCVEGLHEVLPTQKQVTVTYSVAALALWTALLLHGGVRVHYSPGVWGAILGMTLGPQIFGHTLLNWSLRHFPSSVVAFSILLEPVIAALLAWLLLRQALTPVQMLGGLLVLVALALVIGQKTSPERVEDEPVR